MIVSRIYLKSDAEFSSLFHSSHSQSEFASLLGIPNLGGGTYFLLKKRCDDLGLNRQKQWEGAKRLFGSNRYTPDEAYFALNTAHTEKDTRERLLKEGLLPNRCAICGNPGVWRGKSLGLEVDHINGDHFDNRVANLRLLCPNCHSQTSTYSGRNVKRKAVSTLPKNHNFLWASLPGEEKKKPEYFCQRCGRRITRFSSSHLCARCASYASRKVKRPNAETLFLAVYQDGIHASARHYGVSDGALRKWLEAYSLPLSVREIQKEGAKRGLKKRC